MLPVVLAASTILTLMGTFCTSFSFEINGLLSEFLFGGELDKPYSLFSIGVAVAEGRYEETGLVGLEVAFVMLAVAVPAALLVMLLVLWVVPLSLLRQKRLAHACHMFDAWASLDVAALVLIIALFEFGKLAEWLVYAGNFAAPCQMIKDLTKDECLQVEIRAFSMLGVTFFSSALIIVVPKVTLWMCEAAIQRRTQGTLKEGVKEQKLASSPGKQARSPEKVVVTQEEEEERSPLSGGNAVLEEPVVGQL